MEALFVSKWATWEKSLQTGVGLTDKTDKTDSACMEKSLQTGVGLTDKIDKTDSEAMPRAMAQMPCPCVVCGG